MTYDATNRKDIRRAQKAADELERTRVEFLSAAMRTKQGRAWFYHFLADCHAFNNAPTFESNRDYFQFGERNVGLRIFNEILTHFPDSIILMQKEENERVYLSTVRDANADAVKSADDAADADSIYDDPKPGDAY
jgi:hypothetical protein